MPKRENSKTGGELFIVDNSDDEWKALRYLRDWCDYARSIDVATGNFEIGSMLALDGQWQKVDGLRVLMGDEVTLRTRTMFEKALSDRVRRLDDSLEAEKEKDDFLGGLPAIVEREGRVLTAEDQLHYRRMITALGRTAELMVEIDAVIARHGGWPNAFRGMMD